jgi:AraC-like DNA-binding protein
VRTITQQSDGDFGCWSLTQSRPRHLFGLVESIWHFEGAIPQTRERHLPNGLLELVVHFGGRFGFERNGIRERCPAVCLTGLQTASFVIEAPPHESSVLGMRLYPAGAFAIIGGPLHEATERLVDLEDLVGRASNELAKSCAASSSAEGRVSCAAHWASERIAHARGLDRPIAWAVAQIARTHGSVRIGHLQDQIGFSKKGLLKAFREQVGVTPKVYARIMRFRQAITLLHDGRHSLAEIAAIVGYYDQPHMNLDFRELGGLAPGDFLATTRYSPTTMVG